MTLKWGIFREIITSIIIVSVIIYLHLNVIESFLIRTKKWQYIIRVYNRVSSLPIARIFLDAKTI